MADERASAGRVSADADDRTSGPDVSQFEARARRLERQRDELAAELDDVYRHIDEAVIELDDEWRFTRVNERAEASLECDEADLLETTIWTAFPGMADTTFETEYRRAMATQQPVSFEAHFEPLAAWFEVRAYPSRSGLSIYFDDVTVRKERERELKRYERIVDALGDPVYELDARGRFRYVNRAVAEQFGYQPHELLGKHVSVGMDAEAVERGESLIRELLDDDSRGNATLEYEVETKDGERIPVENNITLLTDDDENFQGTVGIHRDLTGRKERERELEQQRERLAALNNLNDVVRDITEAVIDGSTREEIERSVCERLAAAESYRFAWIAEVDPATERMRPRIEAGVDGYLEETRVSASSDEPAGRGPAGNAVRTGNVQVIQDVMADLTFEPWLEYARKYGYSAVATIPISYEGTLYGVLGVYTDRQDAFAAEERAVIGQLGEVVGYAIAAVERKRALLSDEVVELSMVVTNAFADSDVAGQLPERITFDRIVPVGGDEYLVYGTVSNGNLSALEALQESLEHWTASRVVEAGRDDTTFELGVVDPPLLTKMVSLGANVEELRIEDGDFHHTIQHPADVETREIVEAARNLYPAMEVRAKRQVTRTLGGPSRIESTFEELTDRQRTVVESAYFAGYFDWPRASSGEDVSEALSISPATFSQHLRTAQKRIFAALFEDGG